MLEKSIFHVNDERELLYHGKAAEQTNLTTDVANSSDISKQGLSLLYQTIQKTKKSLSSTCLLGEDYYDPQFRKDQQTALLQGKIFDYKKSLSFPVG